MASYSDLDFYFQQRENERKWTRPFVLALVFHIVAFGLSITLPEILNRRPLLDQVVTVNLVSLPDSGPPQQESQPAEAQPAQAEPEAPKNVVSIPDKPKVEPAPAKPAQPVSLKPLKRKVKVADPDKLAQEEAKRRQEEERRKALAKAKEEEQKAKVAAEDARSALAEMIRRQGVNEAGSSSARRPSDGKRVDSIVAQNYYAALYDRVKSFWILPEMRQWDASLETVIVATVLRNGSIAKTVVEKKSSDPFFDQLAVKALQKAAPLPEMPKLLKMNSIEIGFRFRPGELSTTN